MTSTLLQRAQAIEWCVARRTAPGESVSGDLEVVCTWDGGALVGVLDGVGHGPEAATAARLAAEVLKRDPQAPLTELVQQCHVRIRETRGVVMTLVSFAVGAGTASTLGVGNVEAVVCRSPDSMPPREAILLRNGLVGYQLPPLQTTDLPIAVDDLVVFATDGVREDYPALIDRDDALPCLVDRIMTRKFRGTDDGLVLACKYRGSGA